MEEEMKGGREGGREDLPEGQGWESISLTRLGTPSKQVSKRAQKMCWCRGANSLQGEGREGGREGGKEGGESVSAKRQWNGSKFEGRRRCGQALPPSLPPSLPFLTYPVPLLRSQCRVVP